MSYPDPTLEPPFLGEVVPAKDADFPVQITERARKRLFWHFALPPGMQKQGPKGRAAWLIGDRMISCNGYDGMEDPSGDIALGPRSGGGWNECWPVVADLLTDDLDSLEARKRLIPGELWSRCKEQGSLRLARGDRARDGRPWHSRVAIRDQKKKEWQAPGGYRGSR